ncbi:Uu.00g102180.m01.CDS01 [Anthostomella pinea]|uniref:Uu.00g102180.m01.CDS01 n=1 Tax=Anthostomella pinea TaxID=933095 RepID=A0AAI8V882_9PEZI|nr:Uu.00g102180.m01.CDS01 [Anthostomella pinea]
MANLPVQHPNLSLHLTDRALNPLITSSSSSSRNSPSQLQALTSLSHTALNAHESALRLGLGSAQRIMVEHADGGPVLLQTFLNSKPSSASSSSSVAVAAAVGRITTATNGMARLSIANGDDQQEPGALALAASTRNGGLEDASPLTLSSTSPYTTTAGPSNSSNNPHLRGGADDPQTLHLDNNNPNNEQAEHDDDEEDANTPPMLVGLVVAPSADDTLDARRAAARLERVGREIQSRWTEVQDQSRNQSQSENLSQRQIRGRSRRQRGGAGGGVGGGEDVAGD